MMQAANQPKIYTVSELTYRLKSILEEKFSFVWISGEISNFHLHSSGHYYFTLKDPEAQIGAVIFRSQNRSLKFVPKNGMRVTGFGRISVYDQRGTYQIIFEYLEPTGVGALQISFEQLKSRLASEGLFNQDHKKPIPFLPQRITIITSPTGAVIHDMLHIINRRFPNMQIEIIPVKVQGEGAEQEIISAIQLMNFRKTTDVGIIARGGGSLEDLHAFNSEGVARAIYSSAIPIISAVGHETDVTIADFVADCRAPTPSAAAELVVPVKSELMRRCSELTLLLTNRFYRYLDHLRSQLHAISNRLVDPSKRIQDLRLKLDDYSGRLFRQIQNILKQRREQLEWRVEKISALSPFAILTRGYSITRLIPKNTIVKDIKQVDIGSNLEIIISNGSLICRIEGIIGHDKTKL